MLDTAVFQSKHQSSPLSFWALFFSLLAAFGSAFTTLFLARNIFTHAPSYPDFIVGAITWDAAEKIQDLASYPAFMLGFLIGGWLAYRIFQTISIIGSKELNKSLITTLIWWLVPVAIYMGGFLSIYPSGSSYVIFAGIAGAVVSTLSVRIHLSYGETSPQQIGIGVIAVMMIGLFPFGFAAIQDRLPIFSEVFRFVAAPRLAVLLVISATLYLFYLCRSSSTAITQYVQKLLLVAQLGVALFYLLILPDLYLAESGSPAIQTTLWLWILSLAFVLAAMIDVLVKYRNFVSKQETDLTLLLSPIAIFATIILFRYGATVIPHVPGDDYHFGESLLGWWSYSEFGRIPYINYFPPHGVFADDFGGLISLIFYDGTAATLAEADRLAATLTMFVAFIALRLYTGSLGLAYISILFFGTIARKLFLLILVPFFSLWLKTSNLKPQRWLWFWFISAMFLVLLVPPQGLLTVIASSPLVALYIYQAGHSHWKRNALLLAILSGLLVLVTPVPEMLYGAFRYVLENGPINQIAYGVPWSWSWGGSQDKGNMILLSILELLRMSWIWVPLVSAAFIAAMFRNKERRPYLIGVALPVLLFASLMTPYTLGRIDPAAMSRPGLFANFAWTILLPILLTPLLAARGKAFLAVGIAFVCTGIGLATVNEDGLHSVLEKNQIGKLWSGAEHDLKNMGSGLVEQPHVDRLERINSFLSSHLAPREAYLDLTGHNAEYMYFDRPPAMSTTAPYNLAPIKQQQREVEQLIKSMPRIALIEADNINHDGGGMALRTHLLYRFVLKHYDAELHDGYVYGIAKGTDLRRTGIGFTLRQLTDPNWVGGVHRTDNAIVIRDSLSARYLQVGDVIMLSDDKPRKIIRILPESNTIWFDGSRFTPNISDNNHEIQVVLDEHRKQQLSARLMEHVFAVADLRKVPVAWGQSAGSLNGAMKHIVDLDFLHAESHDLIQEFGNYRIVGTTPYLWLNLAPQNIAGQSAGLLKFDLTCDGAPNPRMRVYWWGDEMQGAEPSQSLIFTASNATVIIPLDAYPGWLSLKQAKGLRVELESASTCQTLSIQRASLNQRINISE